MAIVIFHYGVNIFPFSNESVSSLFKQANIGVSYFFILSGFIMIIAYGSYNKISPAEYLKSRFARIYPLLVLSVVLFIVAAYVHGGVNLTDVCLNLSTIQAWIPDKATVGNFPLWSLSVEIFFYLCFPFFFNYFYKKYSITTSVIMIVLVWIVSISVQHYLLHSSFYTDYSNSHSFIYYFPVMHLNQFLAGNLAGLLFIHKTPVTGKKYDILVVMVIIGLILLLKYPFGIDYHNGFLAVVFIPLIYFQAKSKGPLTVFFSKKPFVFLGEISFGIYMLQIPVFMIMQSILAKLNIADPTVIFYLGIVVLIAASAVCHIYIELPLRNRIKNIQLRPLRIK
jgi:peptidoglycan/LPS O-acetylase OafA/YrhL